MVWVIFIHVIIEVIDISLTQTHANKVKFIFTFFSFCNCIIFGGMAEKRKVTRSSRCIKTIKNRLQGMSLYDVALEESCKHW